jgi:hypothetical protein
MKGKKENFISLSLNIMKWFVLNLAFLLSISQLLSVSSDDPTATPTPTSAPTPAPTPAPAAVVVPECPYEAAENGSLICPEVKSGGAIPKLMQCANKVKNEFANICKSMSFSPNMYQSFKPRLQDCYYFLI